MRLFFRVPFPPSSAKVGKLIWHLQETYVVLLGPNSGSMLWNSGKGVSSSLGKKQGDVLGIGSNTM